MVENTYEYSSWGLPEGAKARLGENEISGNIAYSPDGAQLAVASNIGIWLYDVHTGRYKWTLGGHRGNVSFVAFSVRMATRLPVGSTGGTIRLWDASTGTTQGNS